MTHCQISNQSVSQRHSANILTVLYIDLQNSTTPVRKIYAPTNFRNVIPVNSLFDQDPSDHECDMKDFEDNTTPCLGCHKIRFPRSYCPDQRVYACTFDCENWLLEKHGAECYKTHELIFKSFDSIT